MKRRIAVVLGAVMMVSLASPIPVQAAAQGTATKFLGNVYFGMDSSHLDSKSTMKLKKIVRNTPDVTKFKLKGYVQDLGPSTNNFALSLARAKSVKAYLKKLDVTVPIKLNGKGVSPRNSTLAKARRVSVSATVITIRNVTVAVDPVDFTWGEDFPTFTSDQDAHLTGLDCGVFASSDALFATPLESADLTVADSPYIVHCTATAADGYEIDEIVDSQLTVSPAQMTITADDQTITFGDALPTFSASSEVDYTTAFECDVFESTDTEYVTALTANDLTVADSPYVIHCVGTADSNHEIVEIVDGELTVEPFALTVNVADKSTYPGAPSLPSFTSDVDANLDSLTCGVYAQNDAEYVTALAAGDLTIEGSPYVVHCSAVASAGYEIDSIVDGSLEVALQQLTVTAQTKAIVSGSALPEFTTDQDSHISGSTCAPYAVADGAYATPLAAGDLSVAGSPYVIHCTGGTPNAGYEIDSYVDGVLVVFTPADVPVSSYYSNNIITGSNVGRLNEGSFATTEAEVTASVGGDVTFGTALMTIWQWPLSLNIVTDPFVAAYFYEAGADQVYTPDLFAYGAPFYLAPLGNQQNLLLVIDRDVISAGRYDGSDSVILVSKSGVIYQFPVKNVYP